MADDNTGSPHLTVLKTLRPNRQSKTFFDF